MASAPPLYENGSDDGAHPTAASSRTNNNNSGLGLRRGQTLNIGTIAGDLHLKAVWQSSSARAAAASKKKEADDVDVDLAAVCFDGGGNAVEAVFFNHTTSTDGSIRLLSGDQRKGSVGEEVAVSLRSVPAHIRFIAFVATVYDGDASGAPFDAATSAASSNMTMKVFAHVKSTSTDVPPPLRAGAAAEPFDPQVFPIFDQVALLMCLDRRDTKHDAWQLSCDSALLRGHTFVDALPALRRSVGFPPDSKTAFSIPVQLEKNQQMRLFAGNNSGSGSGVGGRGEEGILRIGCGWDIVGGEECDVDLSVICFDSSSSTSSGRGATNAVAVDVVYWGKLQAFGGAITHTGDNLTGEGEGDDEAIVVDLNRLPSSVSHCVFVVSNYSQGTLRSLRNIHFRLVRQQDNAEIVRFDSIGAGGIDYKSFIACSIARCSTSANTDRASAVSSGGGGGGGGSAWIVKAHAAPSGGKVVTDAAIKASIAEVVFTPQPTVKPLNLRSALKGRQKSGKRIVVATAAQKNMLTNILLFILIVLVAKWLTWP